jgi:hypothetical protein
MTLQPGHGHCLSTAETTMNKTYRSYLLRVWQSNERGQPVWLASLEDPHTRRVLHFNSLEELWRFLKEQVALSDSTSPLFPDSQENDR